MFHGFGQIFTFGGDDTVTPRAKVAKFLQENEIERLDAISSMANPPAMTNLARSPLNVAQSTNVCSRNASR